MMTNSSSSGNNNSDSMFMAHSLPQLLLRIQIDVRNCRGCHFLSSISG